MEERRLGSVRAVGVHALGEEAAAEAHTVDASGELPFVVRLDGVRESKLVKSDIRLDHLLRDPCSSLTGPPLRRAAAYDLLEGGVGARLVRPSADRPLESLSRMEAVELENESWIGRPPEDRLASGVPGEDPHRVGGQQAVGGEIASRGEKPVSFGVQ